MSPEVNKEIQLEIAHVLFIDIVGYSKLLITEQSEQLQTLKQIVRGTEQFRIAGAGINVAQRVMDCGDAGHILLSQHVAEDLEQYPRWRSHLHDLGECEVKHGVRVHAVNFYTDEVGNPQVPERFKTARAAEKARPKSAIPKWALVGA